MKIKVFWILMILVSFIYSCSNNKKQTLEPEVKKERQQTEQSDFSSVEIFKGEKKDEIRRVDIANPPIIIDISGDIESSDAKMNPFGSKVNFLKLEHPKSNEGKIFKIRGGRYITSIPSMSHSMTILAPGVPWPTFLSTRIYKDWILVGNLSGLFCYTKDGKYLYTLLDCNEFDDIDMSGPLEINMKEGNNILCGFSVMDDICAFVSATQGKATLHFFDLINGEEVYRKTIPIREFSLLNGKHKTILNYSYEVRAQKSLPFMHTLTAENDTICSFYNKNIFTDMRGMSSFHNPGRSNIYNYKEKLHVRQQGNDTIYRFKSEYEINPAYVFKTGKYQATIQDLIKGNTKDKRSIYKIIETDQLLIFSLQGLDEIYYYDKSVKKVYKSTQKLEGYDLETLPTEVQWLSTSNNVLYDTYTLQTLNNIIENSKEFGFTEKELIVANKWQKILKEGEVLLMMLE